MPYAANGSISQSPVEGGIEISDQQYAEALAGILAGRLVSIDGGFAVIDPPQPEAPPAPEPQEPGIPQVCTRRQGRLALIDAGKLLQVEAAIEAITDPIEQLKARVEYEADTWERANAFLQFMWAQLGGTETELDNLFILASTK